MSEDKAAEIITEKGADAIQEAAKEAAPETAKTDLPEDANAEKILPKVAAQLVAFSEENQRLKEENEELQIQAEEKEDETVSANFAEMLRCKVAPRYRPAVRAMMKAVGKKHDSSKLDFSEGGKSKALLSTLEALIKSLSNVVDFGEVAKKGTTPKTTTVNPLLTDAERRASR